MKLFTKFGLITVVALMTACAPVEPKPTITAPTELEIIEPAPIIEERVAKPIEEVVVKEPEDAPIDQSVDQSVEEITLAKEEPVAPSPPPPPPPPLPDPFDPIVLIGASPSYLQATLGRYDHSFDNSGMSVHHYRQEGCLLLVFINQANEIAHIDLRHQLVNQDVDIDACHQELGVRKDAVK